MSRPLLILIVVAVAVVAVLLGLATLDREVPVVHVERAIANDAAAAH